MNYKDIYNVVGCEMVCLPNTSADELVLKSARYEHNSSAVTFVARKRKISWPAIYILNPSHLLKILLI